MKIFYTFTLLLGIVFAVVIQLTCFVLPKDYFVSKRLLEYPDEWSMSTEGKLSTILSEYSIKTELSTTLEKRIEFQHTMLDKEMWLGIALIIMSVIGFVRELIIGKRIKKAEHQVQEGLAVTCDVPGKS